MCKHLFPLVFCIQLILLLILLLDYCCMVFTDITKEQISNFKELSILALDLYIK